MEKNEERVFSSFQKIRQEFVPVYPDSLHIDSSVVIKKEEFGVKEEIKPLFKTLLGESGMPYVELSLAQGGGKHYYTHWFSLLSQIIYQPNSLLFESLTNNNLLIWSVSSI